MLEFIILGQVPGTNIYLSFTVVSAVLLATTIVSGIATTKRLHQKHKEHMQNAIKQQTI